MPAVDLGNNVGERPQGVATGRAGFLAIPCAQRRLRDPNAAFFENAKTIPPLTRRRLLGHEALLVDRPVQLDISKFAATLIPIGGRSFGLPLTGQIRRLPPLHDKRRTFLAGFKNSQVGAEIRDSVWTAMSVKPAQAFGARAAKKAQRACICIGIPVPQTNQSDRIDI